MSMVATKERSRRQPRSGSANHTTLARLPRHYQDGVETIHLLDHLPVEEMSVTHVLLEKGQTISEHIHSRSRSIIVALQGEAAVWLDGKRYRVVKNDLLFIPPGTRHRFQALRKFKFLTIQSPPVHTEAGMHDTQWCD